MKKLIIIAATLLSLHACANKPATRAIINPELPEWQASWIGGTSSEDRLENNSSVPARYLRREFRLDKEVQSAVLHISGLGHYKAWINGMQVGAGEEFAPTPSHYVKTVYFNTYDVSRLLRKGPNAIGVVLGNGRFLAPRIDKKGKNWNYGLPRLVCQLELNLKDGSSRKICSDGSWKFSADGPIGANNEYDGEVYDARKGFDDWTRAGFDDAAWKNADTVSAPGGKLRPQPNPNCAVQDIVKPVSISKAGDVYILDMGQNMVGWLQFKAHSLNKGDTLRLRFSETLDPAGNLYLANLRSAKVTDYYIAGKDSKVTWHPSFVFHGFRYVELKGWKHKPSLKDFEGQVVYDRMSVTGHFKTSDAVLNQVYDNCFRGIRGNYSGIPTDCPQRDERRGWMGDHTIVCYGESYIFDNRQLYSKWLQDIEDSMTEAGELPVVAPPFWVKYKRQNMTWSGAFVTVAHMLYTRYGDIESVKRHYPAIKKWMDYMWESFCTDGIITRDEYGDWCVPPESLNLIHSKDPARITNKQLISTAFYYYLSGIMEELAVAAGVPAEEWTGRREEVKAAFNREWFRPDEGVYDNNTVTANALPLYFGMVPAGQEQRVFANLVDKCGDHVNCGLVGVMVLMRTLSEYGRPDLAYKIASNSTYPSWGYMATQGATTIWELWNGNTAAPDMNSMNHVMMIGDLNVWEYEYLAGIRPAEPGYKKVELKPYPVDGLDWVNCSYESVSGKIVSNWRYSGGLFEWDVEVAVPARILLPTDTGREEREVAPGTYHFESRIKG